MVSATMRSKGEVMIPNVINCETQKAHIFGSESKCIFCGMPKPDIDLSKNAICEFIKLKRDTATGDEKRYFGAVYFVLRNRTEEHWGPKDLTKEEAMSGRLPYDSNHDRW